MIESFKQDLHNWLFQRLDRRSYFRQHQVLRWFLYETQLSKRDTRVRINLGIGINDPFLDDHGCGLICLKGDVEPAGIIVHFDETPYWWSNNDLGTVLSIVEKCALPWFHYWSETQLIQHFKKPHANVIFGWPCSETSSMPRIDTAPVTRKPPIHQHWLALLYYHQKDYRTSLLHANRWFEKVQHLTDDPEPQRTLRQIAALTASLT